MTEPITRVAAHERIANLDVLRGLAILLILLMNINYMGDLVIPDYRPQRVSWTAFDQAAWWLNRMLDGTQRGLLELLFGAGILIMARTAMTADGPVGVADLHFRRNMWLAVFGIANGVLLLWPGDILLSYACAALLVWPLRTLRPRQLLIIGTAMSLVLVVPYVIRYADRVALAERVEAGDAKATEDYQQIERDLRVADPKLLAEWTATSNGPFAPFVATMQGTWVYVQFTGIGIYYENFAEAFAVMLIGMALYKLGILQGRAPPRTYWLLLLIGYGIGIALRAHATLGALRFDAAPHIGLFTQTLSRVPMTLGHVGAVTLLLGTATGARLLKPFQATGRMPLTTYLGASVIGALLFGPIVGWFGLFGFGGLAIIAFTVMAVQLAGANLWLRHFETGPVEWLWKSLAYNRRQSFRKRDPLIGAEATA